MLLKIEFYYPKQSIVSITVDQSVIFGYNSMRLNLVSEENSNIVPNITYLSSTVKDGLLSKGYITCSASIVSIEFLNT